MIYSIQGYVGPTTNWSICLTVVTCIAFAWAYSEPSEIAFVALIICLFFLSIVITALGTSLIIFRIVSATRNNLALGSRAPYRRIQRIILDSGIIYSAGMLVTGVALVVSIANPLHGVLGEPLHIIVGKRKIILQPNNISIIPQIVTYSQTLLIPFAVSSLAFICSNTISRPFVFKGIAPTLIALRVVKETSETGVNATKSLSYLTFNRHVPQTTTLDSAVMRTRSG